MKKVAGTDGLYVSLTLTFERFAKKYGKEKIMVGNIDSRILQFENKEDIREEVERCTRFGKECPGYFYCAFGHLNLEYTCGEYKVLF